MTTQATEETTHNAESQNRSKTRLAVIIGDKVVSDKRRESLTLAADAGADDATLALLMSAVRLARRSTIVLPRLHLATLSRGRGWCRQGRGDGARWGEDADAGYRVGVGHWTVGATDGFRRKDSTEWTVKHVTVGTATWTVAS